MSVLLLIWVIFSFVDSSFLGNRIWVQQKHCNNWDVFSKDCNQCKDGYGIVDGRCLPCVDENCRVCNGDPNLCRDCKVGFGRERIGYDSSYGDFYYSCIDCEDLLFEGCTSCCEHSDWGESYSDCTDGSYYQFPLCLSAVCPIGQYFDDETYSCQDCKGYCEECERDGDSTLCYICPDGYYPVGEDCHPCGEGCLMCGPQDGGIGYDTCYKGYCGEGWTYISVYSDPDEGLCVRAEDYVDNCAFLEDDFTPFDNRRIASYRCEECVAGYDLNEVSALCFYCPQYGDTCSACNAIGCLPDACGDGYTTYVEDGFNVCIACELIDDPATPDTKCTACTSGGCTECESGYGIIGGRCSLCTDSFGDNCLDCQDSGCLECTAGWGVNGTGICEMCNKFDGNCTECAGGTCTKCSTITWLSAPDTCSMCMDNCAECEAEWPAKRAVEAPVTVEKCLVCDDGFYGELCDSACNYDSVDSCDEYVCDKTLGEQCIACIENVPPYFLNSPTSCSQVCGAANCNPGECNANGKCLDCIDQWTWADVELRDECTVACDARFGAGCDTCTSIECTACQGTQLMGHDGVCCPENCLNCTNGICADDGWDCDRWDSDKKNCIRCNDATCLECDVGFVWSGSDCVSCKNAGTDCDVCDINFNCEKCTNPLHYIEEKSGNCYDVCPEGFFPDDVLPRTCHVCMGYCDKCDDHFSCYAGFCEDGFDFLVERSWVDPPRLKCRSRQFCVNKADRKMLYVNDDEQTCVSCLDIDVNCVKCHYDSGAICDECDRRHFLSPSGTCEKCMDGCMSCSDTLSCDNGKCKDGYYQEEANGPCIKCMGGCNVCSDSGNCATDECDYFYFYQDIAEQGKCKQCGVEGCAFCDPIKGYQRFFDYYYDQWSGYAYVVYNPKHLVPSQDCFMCGDHFIPPFWEQYEQGQYWEKVYGAYPPGYGTKYSWFNNKYALRGRWKCHGYDYGPYGCESYYYYYEFEHARYIYWDHWYDASYTTGRNIPFLHTCTACEEINPGCIGRCAWWKNGYYTYDYAYPGECTQCDVDNGFYRAKIPPFLYDRYVDDFVQRNDLIYLYNSAPRRSVEERRRGFYGISPWEVPFQFERPYAQRWGEHIDLCVDASEFENCFVWNTYGYYYQRNLRGDSFTNYFDKDYYYAKVPHIAVAFDVDWEFYEESAYFELSYNMKIGVNSVDPYCFYCDKGYGQNVDTGKCAPCLDTNCRKCGLRNDFCLFPDEGYSLNFFTQEITECGAIHDHCTECQFYSNYYNLYDFEKAYNQGGVLKVGEGTEGVSCTQCEDGFYLMEHTHFNGDTIGYVNQMQGAVIYQYVTEDVEIVFRHCTSICFGKTPFKDDLSMSCVANCPEGTWGNHETGACEVCPEGCNWCVSDTDCRCNGDMWWQTPWDFLTRRESDVDRCSAYISCKTGYFYSPDTFMCHKPEDCPMGTAAFVDVDETNYGNAVGAWDFEYRRSPPKSKVRSCKDCLVEDFTSYNYGFEIHNDFRGCTECSSLGCSACMRGYFLDGPRCNSCHDNMVGCEECSGGNVCDSCDCMGDCGIFNTSQYKSTEDEMCVRCYLSDVDDNCDGGCGGVAGPACVECEPGYYKRADGYCDSCDSLTSFCADCEHVGGACIQCDDNYGLIDGSCQTCSGVEDDVGLCLECLITEDVMNCTVPAPLAVVIDGYAVYCEDHIPLCIDCYVDEGDGEVYCSECVSTATLNVSDTQECISCSENTNFPSSIRGDCDRCNNDVCLDCSNLDGDFIVNLDFSECVSTCNTPEEDGFYDTDETTYSLCKGCEFFDSNCTKCFNFPSGGDVCGNLYGGTCISSNFVCKECKDGSVPYRMTALPVAADDNSKPLFESTPFQFYSEFFSVYCVDCKVLENCEACDSQINDLVPHPFAPVQYVEPVLPICTKCKTGYFPFRLPWFKDYVSLASGYLEDLVGEYAIFDGDDISDLNNKVLPQGVDLFTNAWETLPFQNWCLEMSYCQQHNYDQTGNDGCISCDENTFNCAECRPGFFLDLEGFCRPCSHASENMQLCMECENHKKCTKCPTFFTGEHDQGGCVKCMEYIPECQVCSSLTTCELCAAGSVKSVDGKCQPCENSLPGCLDCTTTETCTKCAEGLFMSEGKCISLEGCPPGHYGNVDRGQCVPCPGIRDTLGPNLYLEGCLCPAGYEDVAGRCKECQEGFYKSDIGNKCTQCPDFSFAVVRGALSADDCLCEPGYTRDETSGDCVKCGAGTWKDDISDDLCTDCTAHSTTDSTGNTKADSCICEADHYWVSNTKTCDACPEGTWKDVVGNMKCFNCPKGHFCVGGVITECPPGKFNPSAGPVSECTTCKAGTYCDKKGMSVQYVCEKWGYGRSWCPAGSVVEEPCDCNGRGMCFTAQDDCKCDSDSGYKGKKCDEKYEKLDPDSNLLKDSQNTGVGFGVGAGVVGVAAVVLIIIIVLLVVVLGRILGKKKSRKPVAIDRELEEAPKESDAPSEDAYVKKEEPVEQKKEEQPVVEEKKPEPEPEPEPEPVVEEKKPEEEKPAEEEKPPAEEEKPSEDDIPEEDK